MGPKKGVGQHECLARGCGKKLPWFKPFCGRHEKLIPERIIARLKNSDGRYVREWDWTAIQDAQRIIERIERPPIP